METITIPKESFGKIMDDLEALMKDLQELAVVDDAVVLKRRAEIEADPSIGKTEAELDEYLQKRGLRINGMDN